MWFLAELGLYVIQIMLGYLLMLAVMSFNGFITIAIILGATLGYCLSGHLLVERQIRSTRLTAPCQMCISDSTRKYTYINKVYLNLLWAILPENIIDSQFNVMVPNCTLQLWRTSSNCMKVTTPWADCLVTGPGIVKNILKHKVMFL